MDRAKRNMSYRKVLAALPLAWLASLIAAPSFAQDYPNRPVRVIVGNSAGSLADVVSRVVFAKVSELLGQQFLIDTRPGAGGTIAGEAVAKAVPDGYMLLFGSDSVMAIAPHLYTKLGYDPVKDFAGISMIAKIPYGIVAHPSLGVKSVEEFIRLARARPGQINYSSGGIGHATHMNMEMLQWKAGIVLAHVPYKGTGPATQAVLTGEVGASAMGLGLVLPHMQSGKLVGLAIGGPRAGDVLPNVPNLGRLVPDSEFIAWQAVFAPAGTPQAIVEKLNATFARTMAAPEVVKRMLDTGMTTVGSTPTELDQTVRKDISVNRELVKRMGLKVE
ncbi:MAG: tripartite tricarboxylate transporter substrate binding protein [Betaproteobacteria bacterium]|nr:tripartite tricarboxylate transporter substrate binding protein [Betaproteobacteria bacterium]